MSCIKHTTQQTNVFSKSKPLGFTYLRFLPDVLLLIFPSFLPVLLFFRILKLMIWRVDKITKFRVADALIMVIVYRQEKPLKLWEKRGVVKGWDERDDIANWVK